MVIRMLKIIILLLFFGGMGTYFYYFDIIIKEEKNISTQNHIIDSNIHYNEFGMAYYKQTINKNEILTPILKQDGLGISCENYKKRISK